MLVVNTSYGGNNAAHMEDPGTEDVSASVCPAPPPLHFTPTELHKHVNTVLRSAATLRSVRIRGEVTNYSMRGGSAGVRYFAIKDAQNRLDCVLWASCAARCEAAVLEGLHDGTQVEVRGGISSYSRFSKLQCGVHAVSIQGGEGAMRQQLRAWRAELDARGLFDPASKQCVPELLQSLAIVTSADGAALQDILQVLREHDVSIDVRVFPCAVQGRECARTVCAQLASIGAGACAETSCSWRPDAVLLTRGGGSCEDLFEFNRPDICEAIRAISSGEAGIPVIVAVGHQVDTHLSDLVADESCITPTAAAQRIAGAQSRVRAALETTTADIRRALLTVVSRRRTAVQTLAREVRACNLRETAQHVLRNRRTAVHGALAHAAQRRAAHWERLHATLKQSTLHAWVTSGNMAILRTADGDADFDTSILDAKNHEGVLRLVLPASSASSESPGRGMRSVLVRYTVQ